MLYRDNVHAGRAGYQAPGSRSLTQVYTSVSLVTQGIIKLGLSNLSEGGKSLINIERKNNYTHVIDFFSRIYSF